MKYEQKKGKAKKKYDTRKMTKVKNADNRLKKVEWTIKQKQRRIQNHTADTRNRTTTEKYSKHDLPH